MSCVCATEERDSMRKEREREREGHPHPVREKLGSKLSHIIVQNFLPRYRLRKKCQCVRCSEQGPLKRL